MKAKFSHWKDRFRTWADHAWQWTWTIVTSPWRAFKVLCFSLGFFVLVSGTAVGVYVFQFQSSLPRVSVMSFDHFKAKARQHIRKRLENKNKLYRWVSLKDTSRDLLWSVVMSEDSQWREHGGVNWDALVNSMAENIKNRQYKYGASTITQQVAKNLFLTHEKSIVRKVKEIIIARRLESRFTKNEILEVYLNIAEFGPDIFGVRSAAKHYFGTVPAKMNAAQGAFLAVMLPSPRDNHYKVFQNKNLTPRHKRKIKRILRDMHYHEYISAKQFRSYLRYNYFKKGRKRGLAGKK